MRYVSLKNQPLDYDVIVIGGGLIGLSLVTALSNHDLKIAVVENQPFNLQPNTDSRPISLSHASQMILNKIGVWDNISQFSCPIKSVHISEQKKFGLLQFNAEEERVSALGYVVPFEVLTHALYQQAVKQSQVVFINETISKIVTNENGVKIAFKNSSDQNEISSQLLAACDGTESTCRELLNIDVEITEPKEIALTAVIDLQRKHKHIAYERFTSQGTLAILPAQNKNQNYLVWTMPLTLFENIKHQDENELQKTVQTIFGDRLGTFKLLRKTGFFPLKKVMSQEQIRPSAVLLGNAAHTLYPIAAQGFNLGLRDVAQLSQIIISAHKEKQFLGDIIKLEKYLEKRKNDQERVAKFTQRISTTFGLNFPLLPPLRGLGLLTTDLISPLKHRLAKLAMGTYFPSKP